MRGEPRAIQEQVPGAEPLPPRSSAARIERIRRRKRMRRIRAAAVCAVLLAAVLAYFTGIYGASLALLGDAVDSIGIALTPSPRLSRFIYAVRVSECAAAGRRLRGGRR